LVGENSGGGQDEGNIKKIRDGRDPREKKVVRRQYDCRGLGPLMGGGKKVFKMSH